MVKISGGTRVELCRGQPFGRSIVAVAAFLATAIVLAGCVVNPPQPGSRLDRRGDEIVVCGQLFHTGAPVVLWTDPGGYDAYRVERRFVPLADAAWNQAGTDGRPRGPSTPNRYGMRRAGLTEDQIERVRGGGWDLDLLRTVVDQFVLHYDVCGTSRNCFRVLHDQRGLSVHFMLDIDGTIYQTLDVKERAWHATTSNDRSVGIEIANMGAYPLPSEAERARAGTPHSTALLPPTLAHWYAPDADGTYRITIPPSQGDGGVRTAGFVGRPVGGGPIIGEIDGKPLVMFDLTPEQYDSLIKLTATLCTVLPAIPCDYPRDGSGRLITTVLPGEELRSYSGLIGHYHIQENKVDPGPALRWDYITTEARKLMRHRRRR